MDKSVVLQAINGCLAITSLVASFIFYRYILHNTHRGYYELRAAIALFFVFFGTVILRIPEFVARTIANTGTSIAQPNPALIFGGVIVEIASLCIIRVFSPEKWRFWSWLLTLLLSTITVGISMFFVHWS